MSLIPRLLTTRVAIGFAAVVIAGGAAATVLTVRGAVANGATPAQLTAQALQHVPNTSASHRRAFRLPILRALVAATAKETGLSVATIRKDLSDGETLNQIAGSKASAVINDVMTRIKTRVEKAVDAGRITKAQATRLLNRATTRINHLMNAHLPKTTAPRPATPSPTPATRSGTTTTA